MPTIGGVHVYRVMRYVLAPGDSTDVTIVAENQSDGPVQVIVRDVAPPGWTRTGPIGVALTVLPPGGTAKATYRLRAPATHGPALIRGVCSIKREAPPVSRRFETPIACYPPHVVATPEALEDVRDRLVAVTNFHERNGHVLLLDPIEYFIHHLNVVMPEAVRRIVAKEFAFTQVGIPIGRPLLDDVRRGDNKGVLGVRRVVLEADDVDDPCDREYAPRHALAFPKEVQG